MALLPILEFPDPRLRTKAAAVAPAELAEPAFQRLFDDMFETMYDAPGIGLAASQVDGHTRFMVIDVTEDKSRPLVFVNPVIGARQGEQVYQEGCLSVPGIYADVTRSDVITVDALMRELEFMPEPDPAAGCVSPAVFAAILRVARVNRDLRDFDGDKRGIMESAEDAEESLFSLICKDPSLLELVDAGE